MSLPDPHRTAAIERAQASAPKPTGGSFLAGVTGAVVAAGAAIGVPMYYGAGPWDLPWLVAPAAVVGFGVVWLGYKRAGRRHSRAVETELAAPRGEGD